MPPLSRWCVRAAFAYLIAGMALGSWMLILQARRGYGLAHPWPSIHAHLLLVGFLLLLIFGVAFWMFPRVGGTRSRAEAAWLGFALINAGLLGRVLAEPPADAGTGPVAWRVALGVAATLPALGALAFGVALWPRVRAAMSPAEARRLRASRQADAEN
jgi:hypothetical protein